MSAKTILAHHIKEALNGNQTSFNYLLNRYWNDVYLFLQTKTNDENLAEDVAIVTFSKAFDKLEQYKPKYTFKNWLFGIAQNLLIDEYRKQKNNTVSLQEEKNEWQGIADDSPSAEDKIIIEQNLAQLKKNIKELKPKYQEVIHLRFFQDLSYQEIANHLDESINNTKVKLLRAKKLLAEIIANQANQSY